LGGKGGGMGSGIKGQKFDRKGEAGKTTKKKEAKNQSSKPNGGHLQREKKERSKKKKGNTEREPSYREDKDHLC